jgi:protein-tyrosine phosphatase
MVRVCFVCLGNICRSPTAAAVMRHLVTGAGLRARIEVDSAGTAGYHAGEPPDPRACAAGQRCGIDVGGRARKFQRKDFESFDYVLAMDRSNLEDLLAFVPETARHKVSLLRSFDSSGKSGDAVPDPYYGADGGFDEVIELCMSSCKGLLEHIRREHRL